MIRSPDDSFTSPLCFLTIRQSTSNQKVYQWFGPRLNLITLIHPDISTVTPLILQRTGSLKFDLIFDPSRLRRALVSSFLVVFNILRYFVHQHLLVHAIRPWRVTVVYVCVFVPNAYCLICIHREF